MKKRHIINFLSYLMSFHLFAQKSSEQALKIIEKIDKNMFAKTQVVTSEMVVYGKRKNIQIYRHDCTSRRTGERSNCEQLQESSQKLSRRHKSKTSGSGMDNQTR